MVFWELFWLTENQLSLQQILRVNYQTIVINLIIRIPYACIDTLRSVLRLDGVQLSPFSPRKIPKVKKDRKAVVDGMAKNREGGF